VLYKIIRTKGRKHHNEVKGRGWFSRVKGNNNSPRKWKTSI